MIKLHLDTDLGGDIDDLCALAMVCKWPDVDLLAVTTNQDDHGTRAGYVRYALELGGRKHTAVAAGADVSLNCYRVRPGLPDAKRYWPEPILAAPTPLDDALGLLQLSIEHGAIIAAIGAFTNLALLERRSPGSLRQAKLYLMGGWVFPPREGFPQWDHTMDWNSQIDAQSTHFVLQHSTPTLVPLPVTIETSFRRAYLPRLRHAGPLARLIAAQAEVWAEDEGVDVKYGQACAGLPDDTINFLHDPLTCAIALGWHEGVEISEVPLVSEILDGWLRQRINPAGKPTRVVTRVDPSKFNDHWLELVTA